MKVISIAILLLNIYPFIQSKCVVETFNQTSVKMCNRNNRCKIEVIDKCISDDHVLSTAVTIEVLPEVHSLQIAALKSLHNLRVIKMKGIHLKEINTGCFIDLPKARHLYLQKNYIEKIKYGVFNGLNFENIFLSDNKIHSIDVAAFANMSELFNVALDKNKLTKFNENWFGTDNSVDTLDLSYNLITILQPGAFQTLKLLRNLNLRSNSISIIEATTFYGVKLFNFINLDLNHLEFVSPDAFEYTTKIGSLNLALNNLTSLPTLFLRSINVKHLYLYPNPWICKCLDVVYQDVRYKEVSIVDPAKDENLKWNSSNPSCVVMDYHGVDYCNEHFVKYSILDRLLFKNYFNLVRYDDILLN